MYTKTVLPQQAKVLGSEERLYAMRGGIRSGKSVVSAEWIHDRMEMYPLAQHYVIGADLPQLKRGFLLTFEAMLIKYGIPFTKKVDGEYRLTHNGAKLMSLSAEIVDRIRSAEFDSVAVEEPQTWRDGENVFQIVVGRMSGSAAAHHYYPGLDARLRLSFNPRQVPRGHWLHRLIEEQHAMLCEQFSVRQNFLMPGFREFIELQEKVLPQHLWASELDGEYASVGGAVYRYYQFALHSQVPDTLPPLRYHDDRETLLTFDFNTDYMTALVAQCHVQNVRLIGHKAPPPNPHEYVVAEPIYEQEVPGYQHRLFYFIDEVRPNLGEGVGAGVPDLMAELLARDCGNGQPNHVAWRTHGVTLYGDASGGSRSHTQSAHDSVRSSWGLIIQALEANGIPWRWKVQSANPSIGDRVNATCTYMQSEGLIGVAVDHDRVKYLIRDWQSVKWDENGYHQIDKRHDLSLTHASDAGDYLLWLEQRLEWGEDVALKELPDLMGR